MTNNMWPKEDSPEMFKELDEDDRVKLLAWIRGKYEIGDEAFEKTTYGLKHDFQRETGIFVFNGAFKGALVHLNFEPVDPLEQNWHFKMRVKVPEGFYKWVTSNYAHVDSPLGDFARDMEHDFKFPMSANTKRELAFYLDFRFACQDAKDAFEKLWSIYEKTGLAVGEN